MYVTIFSQKFRHPQPCCCAQTLYFINMDTIETILGIGLITFLGFCGVIAPMLMPLFIKDEYKEKFPRYIDVLVTPYLYQSKWFKPKGVLLQRLALMIWIPAILFGFYMWFTGQIKI